MNDDAEKSSEAMLAAVEAVLTETRQTVEALTVSALQQAHAASHRADLKAESSFQAHKDMTVTTKERARKKQLDFLVTCTAASCSQPASSKEVLCRNRGTPFPRMRSTPEGERGAEKDALMRSIWKLKQRRLDGMPALGRMCVWRWGGEVVVGGSEEVQKKIPANYCI